ncbi:bifunctional phosphoribosylaminoimidazolecarboxamide formyltransferase/IMP cyclohydrolase [Phenylobacterium sp. VNQ135]|uniref:bifunctional phosphoribosylaminoimidazolecarboxamide formyltransferase/IMP cyclohydrolase n=1 Tax=Phenylobacterium sp. VNQ135 TaxID=3400922 RepID=UPI003C056022
MPAAPDFPPAPDRVAVRRALLSVSDKTGLVDFAKALAARGVELVSTGGTRKAIADAGLPVKDISELTGFPEMMDGRVKTLHPIVHGGLLGVRDAPTHKQAMDDHGIGAIDLVYVNLYPFEATVAAGADYETAVENIDIGGPAMIRSAAKNHGYVAVCTEPSDMEAVIAEVAADGTTSLALRKRLAARAYARTAAYDAAISTWFAAELGDAAPARKAIAGELVQTMRYGENPHQAAAFYRFPNPRIGVATARQLQGKELSYNNINDTDAAFELIAEFGDAGPACAIIKHANPCGVATGKSLQEAYERALACDPTSAFGGIVALNSRLDAATAAKVLEIFTEVVIAPGADDEAVELFRKKKNVRLLVTDGLPDPAAAGETFRSVSGGFLVQGRDTARLTPADLKVVTKRSPTEAEIRDMLFAFTVAKHVKSNAIVYAREGQTLGVGAGQMNRKDSARIAALRAADFGLDLTGSACASEAFFPFPDGLLQAADAGCTAVIQPGGSIGDDKVIAAADERGVAMVFTGVRVFRH